MVRRWTHGTKLIMQHTGGGQRAPCLNPAINKLNTRLACPVWESERLTSLRAYQTAGFLLYFKDWSAVKWEITYVAKDSAVTQGEFKHCTSPSPVDPWSWLFSSPIPKIWLVAQEMRGAVKCKQDQEPNRASLCPQHPSTSGLNLIRVPFSKIRVISKTPHLQIKAPHSPRPTHVFPLTPGLPSIPLTSREHLAELAHQMGLEYLAPLVKLSLP